MEALLLSDAIQRVTTMRELQELINTQQVKSRLLELSDNHLDEYYDSISLGIVKQFMEYIIRYPQDRNLKLEFIDVINVLDPETVANLWNNKFTKFIADMYLNGDVTMDWVVNLIVVGGEYHDEFFVQVMNDDNEQEVYEGLMEVIHRSESMNSDRPVTSDDNVLGRVGSRHILEQYIKVRGIYSVARLLASALMVSMGRFRLVLNVLLENGHSCKTILMSHLSDRFNVSKKVYGTIISILASDCGINLVELRDELPFSNERDTLEEIINIGDV